jgi:hypothetical protein
MANIVHKVFAQLTTKDGTGLEGVTINITLPDTDGVNDSHVFNAILSQAKNLPYKQDNSTVILGPSSLTQIEAGPIAWAVQESTAI